MRLADLVRPHKRIRPEPELAEPEQTASTLFAMMIKRGRYAEVNSVIEEKFSVRLRAFTAKDTKVFHFRRGLTPSQIKALMRLEGYKPATIEHLLAYCAEHPDVRKKYFLAAPGATCRNAIGEPCIVEFQVDSHCERSLVLSHINAHNYRPTQTGYLGVRIQGRRR